MIKPHSGPHLPTITINAKNAPQGLPYAVDRPGQPAHACFITLEHAIAALRGLHHGRAYLIDGNECYILGWGPLIAPWEGPEA